MLMRMEAFQPLNSRPAAHRGAVSRSALALIVLLTGAFLAWVGYRWVGQPLWIGRLHPRLVELFDLAEWGGTVTLIVLWGMVVWQARQRRLRPTLTRDQLQALTPARFEEYVAALFRRKGYVVTLRGRSGDQGVDLELTKPNGRRAIVQCKRYQHRVGPDVVRELYGTLLHERVAHAFLVTTADISPSARTWAEGKPLTLIDGAMLEYLDAIVPVW
jgi:restriction system protein